MNCIEAIDLALRVSRECYALTDAEIAILRAVVFDARTREQICADRSVAPSTLKKQCTAICRKLGVRSLQFAAVRVMRDALVIGLPCDDEPAP